MTIRKGGGHLPAWIAGAALAALTAASPANAIEYNIGDVSLSVDSIASMGVTVRASGQDCMYVSVLNGGCPDGKGQSANINTDDGNINFEQWDVASAPVKIVSDFEARWENFGAFMRLRAYYDHAIYEEAGQNTTRFGRRPLTDSLRGDDARNSARGVDLLDAFVFANFDVGNQATTLRVGKQVINWGESLAIQGGINQFNSFDVAAIRTPGAELREALLPEESVYVNMLLPAGFSAEAFYAFNWRKTELDAVGTFFASNDIFGPGGRYVNTVVPEQPNPNGPGTLYRARGDMPNDQGQYGAKVSYWADWLNRGTELAAYFVNYHSKVPFLEYSNGAPPAIDGALCAPAPSCGLGTQYYRSAYPEDIKYVGTSFATTVAGSTLAGEALYSWNTPFQISSGEILGAHWVENGTGLPVSQLPYDQTPGAFPKGYFREDVITGQLSTITILNPSTRIPQFLNSDLVTFVTNVGFQYLPSISDARLSVLNGGRGSEITHPNPTVQAALYNPAQPLVHADSFSWGYRLIASTDYNNAFNTPWTLTPNIQWQHGLGTSAGSIGPGFMEDRKTVTVGIEASLRRVWSAELSYTNSFGNDFQNYTQDRDFISASLSYAF
ncbi:DUF1302 domain-containing protein [Parvibaculum sp.]|uniref:DUF1302 domain-containing protein n=2 Tax=Parvibaculum sp. TaxID=2024848 RepID=UPI001B02989A|nr:DUF1302 domain-containing protein [Parvibaculum sp.]MBO6678128.1 DUF1302 domain-containing protein [Parvibaculum sp.]MBO6683724.1 DUF1302 domain-containing protein [Parvibaculum sp.]